MRVEFQTFKGTLLTWEDLFQEAADFASSLGPERVISISHSDSHSKGVVTVWYWSPAFGATDDARAPTP